MPYNLVTFTVEGHFPFPLDMLRYDQCYPANETETARMDGAISPFRETNNIAGAPHRITLARAVNLSQRDAKRWQPTHGRWESFGWKVTP